MASSHLILYIKGGEVITGTVVSSADRYTPIKVQVNQGTRQSSISPGFCNWGVVKYKAILAIFTAR